jgi:hypothetical protein
MNSEEIKAIQKRVGATPDGVWGPKSKAACIAHLKALMPVPNPWPHSDAASLRAFYGNAGDENNLVSITFPFPMYYGGKLVKATRCHKKVADSLLRIFAKIGTRYHGDRGIMEEAEDYGGCFNFRLKRGGTTYSLHAYGAAIDLDDDDNTFKDSWPTNADMPLEIMEEFAKEGWLSAGAFWGYDAMHHQATQ